MCSRILVIDPTLFVYSEFKDFGTDSWQVRHNISKVNNQNDSESLCCRVEVRQVCLSLLCR